MISIGDELYNCFIGLVVGTKMTRVAVFLLLALAAIACAAEFKFPPNKHTSIPKSEHHRHPGYRRVHRHKNRAVDLIPSSFDARTRWPACTSISTIRNQGQCGSCWAVSSSSVLSDRFCIASDGKINVPYSANQAASCPIPSRTPDENCMSGGDPTYAYFYATFTGIETGGAYNSSDGCVPYGVPPDRPVPITCAKKCTSAGYSTALLDDKKQIDTYWINYKSLTGNMTQAEIDAAVNMMQLDLMENGPITAALLIYSDFQKWTPAKSPYYNGPKVTAANLGGHSVRLIGWNVSSSDGVSYWLIANSWGTTVGDRGVYNIRMGRNVAGIESLIAAPTVTIPNNCVTADFINMPINISVTVTLNDPSAPAYLFQGNCTLPVKIQDGTFVASGPAVPINKVFQAAPVGPIAAANFKDGQLWLINSAGSAGYGCIPGAAGSSKFQCGTGTSTDINRKIAAFNDDNGVLKKYSYYIDDPNFIVDPVKQKFDISGLFSNSFASVTGLLNINGFKLAAFGRDAAGQAAAGILAYPANSTSNFSWLQNPGPTSLILKY